MLIIMTLSEGYDENKCQIRPANGRPRQSRLLRGQERQRVLPMVDPWTPILHLWVRPCGGIEVNRELRELVHRQFIDKCEETEEMLLDLKEWVHYWDVEEDLADQIYDHLRLAAYKLRIVRANMQLYDPTSPDGRDI